MANDKEVEIKVTVDTKDATDGFKDIERASDKMAKNVSKDADKIDDSLDDVIKTTKDIQSEFKNINMKSLTSSLTNFSKQAKNIASTIKKQLTDAFNVKGSVQVNTTATSDASGGSNSGSAMSSAMSSIVSGGAIGAQIAKQLSQTKGMFSTTLKEMKSEVNATDLFENMDDSLIKQMNTMKSEVYPIIEHIKECMAEDGVAFDYDFVDVTRGVQNTRKEVELLYEELNQPIEIKGVEGFNEVRKQLHEMAEKIDNFSYGLSESAKELEKLTKPTRGRLTPFDEEKMAKGIELLQQAQQELVELETTGAKIGFMENLDFSKIEMLTEAFQNLTNGVSAEALIAELRELQQEANKFGMSFKGIDSVIQQYDQTCARGGQITHEFKSALIGVGQQFVQYNAQLRSAQQSQELQARKQRELAQSSSNLSKALIQAKYGIKQFGDTVKSSFSQGFKQAQTHVSNLIKKTKEWVKSHTQASKQIKSSNQGLATSFKGLLTSMLPFLSLYGAFNLIKTSITDAMGAMETTNMFSAVFGQNAQDMDTWIKEVNKSMGLGVGQTREYTAIIGQMGSAMGLTSEQSMDLAKSMATMAGDISSFYNVDIAQAQEDLRSALSGSNEVNVIA